MNEAGIGPYLNAAQASERDGLQEYPDIVAMLDELDSLFRRFASGPVVIKQHPATMVLAQSAHSAFLAAAGAALRGQFAPTFMIVRGFIESALYCYLASRSQADAEIWIKRASNPEAAKQRFKAGRAIDILKPLDPHLSSMLKETYAWSIEFGGHPNFRSVAESLAFGETTEEGKDYWTVGMTYIHSHQSAPFMRALIAVVENACTAVAVLCHAMGPEHPKMHETFDQAWHIFRRAQAWLEAEGYVGRDTIEAPSPK